MEAHPVAASARGGRLFPAFVGSRADGTEREQPRTLGSLLGIRKGAKFPGLLRLLKGDAPIEEVAAAARSWIGPHVEECLEAPPIVEESLALDDPQVDLPLPPVDVAASVAPDVSIGEETPRVATEVVCTVPDEQLQVFSSVWDTADLNVHVAKTGEGPIDTLRTDTRWYDPYVVHRRVSAGGFPHGVDHPHFMTVEGEYGILSCGSYLGGFSPDVRTLIMSRYKGVFGFAQARSIVSEGGPQPGVFATGAFARECGLTLPDVDEVVNAWAPFGYIEVVPYGNLRWGGKDGINRLLMESLVLVKVASGRAAPLVFGQMGGCVDVSAHGHPGGLGNDVPGSTMVAKSLDLALDHPATHPPLEELAPSLIVPADLTELAVIDVDTSMNSVILVRGGRTWEIKCDCRLPVGRYMVRHSKLTDLDCRVRLCVVDWLSSEWVSASARLSYLAARDPQWVGMVRPAWAHVADLYAVPGVEFWLYPCHPPGPYGHVRWGPPTVEFVPARLRTDGVFGTRTALRVFGYSTVFAPFGGAARLQGGVSGSVRDQWLGHSFRQWLVAHSGSVHWARRQQRARTDLDAHWNPSRAVMYDGVVGHLSVLGALVAGDEATPHTCLFEGKCEGAPEWAPCFCHKRDAIEQAYLPRIGTDGRYSGALPLTGTRLYYASYSREYHPASHGVRPSYVGDKPSKWDVATWILPDYKRKGGRDMRSSTDLDCLVYSNKRRREVPMGHVELPTVRSVSGGAEAVRAVKCARVADDDDPPAVSDN